MKLASRFLLQSLAQASVLGIAGTTAQAALVWHMPLTNVSTGSIAANSAITAAVNDPGHGSTNGTVIGAGSSWVYDPVFDQNVWSTVQGNRMTAGTQNADRAQGFTWSIWAQIDPLAAGNSDAGAEVIMGTRAGSYFKIGMSGAAVGSTVSSSVNASIAFGAPAHNAIISNNWAHISVVGDNTSLRAYVNGLSAGPADTTFNTSWNSNLELGGSAQFTEDMEGLLRDAAIWNNALTLAQTRGLYTLGAPTSFKYDAGETQSLYDWANGASLEDTFDLGDTTWKLVTDEWSLGAGDLQDAGDGTHRYGYGSGLALITIPEPATALLTATGLLFLLRRRRD